jgi:hypothetical protein
MQQPIYSYLDDAWMALMLKLSGKLDPDNHPLPFALSFIYLSEWPRHPVTCWQSCRRTLRGFHDEKELRELSDDPG